MRRLIALACVVVTLTGCSYADLGEPQPTPIFGAPVPSTAETITADLNDKGSWHLPYARVEELEAWYDDTLGPAKTWSLFWRPAGMRLTDDGFEGLWQNVFTGCTIHS
jgi:hypothetical protein